MPRTNPSCHAVLPIGATTDRPQRKCSAPAGKFAAAMRNREAHEQAMDAQFHIAHTIWKTDLYDSDTFYGPSGGEPDTRDVADSAFMPSQDAVSAQERRYGHE